MVERYSTGAGFTLEQHPENNITSDYTLAQQDVVALVDASGGTVTITLPPIATGDSGKSFYIRKIDSSANTVLVMPNAGDSTISGQLSFTLDTEFMSIHVSNMDNVRWFGTLEGPDARAPASVVWSTKTANYTIVPNDSGIAVDATSGNITISLPSAASVIGKVFHIKKIDSSSNTVTIDPDGSDTIDGKTSLVIIWEGDSPVISADTDTWRIS